jgi:hypothetical protein
VGNDGANARWVMVFNQITSLNKNQVLASGGQVYQKLGAGKPNAGKAAV